jgi:hypothetical protein
MAKKKRRERTRRKRKKAKRLTDFVEEPQAEDYEPPVMTLEEFRQVRDDFFEGIPARIETLKRELVEEMAPFDAFDLLTNLLIVNLPVNAEKYKESEHQGLIAYVEYAALLLLERPSRAGTDTTRLQPIDAAVIPGLQERLREMLSLSSYAAMHAMRTEDEGPRAIDEVRARIVQREIFIRNPTYEWLEKDTLRDLFGAGVVAADLLESLGFDVEDALTFVEALWEIGHERFGVRAAASRDLEEEVNKDVDQFLRGGELHNPEFAPIAEGLRDAPKSKRRRLIRNMTIGYAWSHAGDAMQLTVADLAEHTGRAEDKASSFLEAFAIDFGSEEPTTAFSGSHPLRARPIIRDGEGHYFCTYHGNVLFALRSRFEEALKPREGDAATAQRWERYNRARAKYIEERAVALLRDGLKTDLAWVNPTYVIEGGDRIEIDGLVVIDTVALVVEAKGAALSEPAKRALEPRLKRDIEATLEEAAGQANRLSTAIEKREPIAFADRNGNPIPLDHAQLSRVFPIVVTLDDFSGLSTSVWALAEAGLLDAPEPLPWIASLHELDIVLELVEYAAQLPHFLMRRRRVNELKLVRAADELDFLVFYLTSGLFFDDVVAGPDAPDFIGIESMTDDVDAYYFVKQGLRKGKAKKPSAQFDPLSTRFLKQLDDERPPGFVEASIALLTMSDASRREFTKHIRRLSGLTAKDGAFHDVTLGFGHEDPWGVTVITGPLGRGDDLARRLAVHVALKKHQFGTDLWIGFGVIVGAKGTFHVLVVDYAPWVPDNELDRAVEETFENQPSIGQMSEKKRRHLEEKGGEPPAPAAS